MAIDALEPAHSPHCSMHWPPTQLAGMAYSRHVLIDANNRMLGQAAVELITRPEALLRDFMTGPLRIMRQQAVRDGGGFASAHAERSTYDYACTVETTGCVNHVPQCFYRRRIHRSHRKWRAGRSIEARYAAFVDAVRRRGWMRNTTGAAHRQLAILQPLRGRSAVRGIGADRSGLPLRRGCAASNLGQCTGVRWV